MKPKEIQETLAAIIAPLGKDARSYTSISSGDAGLIYMSAERGWQADADKLKGHYYPDYEAAFSALQIWVNEAPLRNRVATAADLGIPE